MKQESQSEINDRVIRRALAGETEAYICVDAVTNAVVINTNARPAFVSLEYADKFQNSMSTHIYVKVDPRDPYRDVFLEETDKGDRWVYRPLLILDTATGNVTVAGPSKVEVATAVKQFQQELDVVAPQLAEVLETCSEHGPKMVGPDGLCGICEAPVTQTVIVRHSELVDAASCLKAYQLKWIKNLRPRRTDAKLATGTLVHAFMDAYEPLLADTSASAAMVQSYAEKMGFAAVDEKYEELVDDLLEIDSEGRTEAAKAWSIATRICEGYIKWRPTTDLSPIQQSEATFNFEIGEMDGVRVILSGTMDGIGVTHETGPLPAEGESETPELWLREYKTCKSISDKLKQYRLDKQTRRYVGAARLHGVEFVGVELVLAAKTLPLPDKDFVLKDGSISKDKGKWAKADYEQALRVAELGKLAPSDSEKGLTEQGFHDILKTLKDRPNPFFHMERLRFNKHELDTTMGETLIEAHRLHVTRVTSDKLGDRVWTRNQGAMGFNCKSCSVRDLCEMELKGVDTEFHVQEHFYVDSSIHAGKETDDADDTDD